MVKKNKKKITVTVGVCAYNEEQNIAHLLTSVLAQKETNFVLKEIIVLSDGSTDHTAKIVKDFTDPRLKLYQGKNQLGKMIRLNKLLKLFRSDILVHFDADVVLNDELVVARLVNAFKQDTQIGLVGGNPQPLSAETFIEGIVNSFLVGQERVKQIYDFSKTAQGANGRILAYARQFTQQLRFPHQLLAEDGYSYLKCLTLGYKFKYLHDTVVWYRSPQTLADYFKQATRFLAGHPQLYEYFPQNLVDKAYSYPANVQLQSLLIQLKKNPFKYLLLKLIHYYCWRRTGTFLQQHKLGLGWQQIISSKRVVSTERKL